MNDLARRRDAAATIAIEAACLAARLRVQGGGVASLKGAQDFITEADGATERFIRDRLEQDFPGESILGEEMGGAVDGAGPLWVLDPIDGTANFARGGDRWCVSIGLVIGNRAVAGAIARHAPAEIFAAAEGLGATLNGAPIHAAPTTDIGRAIIECGWSLRLPIAAFHRIARPSPPLAPACGGRLGRPRPGGQRGRAARRLSRKPHQFMGCGCRHPHRPRGRLLDQCLRQWRLAGAGQSHRCRRTGTGRPARRRVGRLISGAPAASAGPAPSPGCGRCARRVRSCAPRPRP